jgi:hypothetical protein
VGKSRENSPKRNKNSLRILIILEYACKDLLRKKKDSAGKGLTGYLDSGGFAKRMNKVIVIKKNYCLTFTKPWKCWFWTARE